MKVGRRKVCGCTNLYSLSFTHTHFSHKSLSLFLTHALRPLSLTLLSLTSDCLEYVLREKVLETLCLLGAEDRPSGIRRVCINSPSHTHTYTYTHAHIRRLYLFHLIFEFHSFSLTLSLTLSHILRWWRSLCRLSSKESRALSFPTSPSTAPSIDWCPHSHPLRMCRFVCMCVCAFVCVCLFVCV